MQVAPGIRPTRGWWHNLIDVDVTHVLRKMVAAGELPTGAAQRLVGLLPELGLTRYPMVALLARVWELRANVSAHDATYVALAEALDCDLPTADARLARAPGLRCPVTVVP